MSGIFIVAWSPIKNVFLSFAYNFLLILDKMVYTVLTWVYQIFYMLTEVNLFNNNDAISEITERIYVVLGVVMLFVFAYNIIILLTNPDKLSKDNSLTKIIRDTVISLVLIAFLPTLFNLVYSIQSRVLETNVIGNIILGGSSIGEGSEESPKQSIKKAGNRVATSIFTTFYHPLELNGTEEIDITALDCRNGSEHALCPRYIEAIDSANSNDGFNALTPLFNDETLRDGVIDGNMKYMFIISTICGCIAIYLFASFAFDIGVRAVKLAILQLVAPVPIMLRITKPTGGIFSKWLKELKDTYLSLFVRLAIIYFAIFTIDLVWRSKDLFSIYDQYGGGVLQTIAELVLILSILVFAKEAPKLIKNIVGGSGDIEWNLKKKLNGENYEYARRAMGGSGTVGANLGRWAFNGITRKSPNGGLRALPKNIVSGFKYGWKNGGGNVENLRGSIRNSMAQTEKDVERMRSRNARIQETRNDLIKNTKNPVSSAIARIPGVGRLVAKGTMKWNDFKDAVGAEGDPNAKFGDNFIDYLSNRINFSTSGVGAEAAGAFRKQHANIVDSDLIQSGIKNKKEQAMREEEHIREYYNTRNMPLNEQIANLKSKYIAEQKDIEDKRKEIFSSKEYADFDAERAKIDAKARNLENMAGYSTYKTTRDKIDSDASAFKLKYDTTIKNYEAEKLAIQKENQRIASDVTLTNAAKDLALKDLSSRWSQNEQLKVNLDSEKVKFDADILSRETTLASTKIGAEFAKIEAERDKLKNGSTVFQNLMQLDNREKLNEEYRISIEEPIKKLNDKKNANLELMKDEIKELNIRKDKAIQDQYMINLQKNASDIHAYYVNNLSEIRAKFNEIPDSAQRIIFESAGFKDAQNPNFNLKEALNAIGNIILNEEYDEDETKMIMGFFKGLKKVENRGPFDYRLSRMQDATSGKDGGKK